MSQIQITPYFDLRTKQNINLRNEIKFKLSHELNLKKH